MTFIFFTLKFFSKPTIYMGFPGGSVVKNTPAMQETWVYSLGEKDLLEKEMATRSSSLAWEVPRTEEPGGLQSTVSQKIHTHLSNCCCCEVTSVTSDFLWPPWAVAHQAPLSMGILQARLLEWVAMPSSRRSSWPRDRTANSLPLSLQGSPDIATEQQQQQIGTNIPPSVEASGKC